MESRDGSGRFLGNVDTLFAFFFLISNIMKITMMTMIIVAAIGRTMIVHGCSYQASSLLVFVVRPFSPVVEEDDGG